MPAPSKKDTEAEEEGEIQDEPMDQDEGGRCIV